MNKTSGCNEIPAELFQILKDDAVKVLYTICQQIWKTQRWPQEWKRSVFILIPKKSNAKNVQSSCAHFRYFTKVILKVLQARLQQYVNKELLDVKTAYTKGKTTSNQIANIHWIIKKARELKKNI